MSNDVYINTAIPLAKRQSGVALIFVLIMMSMVFIVAAVSSRLVTSGERAARNDRDRQTAFQAAEAALADAEVDIMGPNTASNSRVSFFGKSGADSGCSNDANARGFCGSGLDATAHKAIFKEESATARQYVTYGEFTDRADQFPISSTGALPVKLPRYIIEKASLNFRNRGEIAGKPFDGFVVTAIGYGIQPNTEVVLQILISKPVATN
jgi:type IV pilus assembly protein PilX